MSQPTFVLAFVAAYLLGRLVAAALSSTWFVRLFAAALVGLVIVDVIHIVLPAWR